MIRRTEALSPISHESPIFTLRGVTVPLPQRTGRQPRPDFDREWLHLVGNRWTDVCNTALDRLNSLPFSPSLRTLLEQPTETLTHTMKVSKSAIRKDILGFKKNKKKEIEDIRITYQYFSFGKEVGQDESMAAELETTPIELFQLYAVVIARKTINAQWLSRADQKTKREVSPIKWMMEEKPFHGGPLMTAHR